MLGYLTPQQGIAGWLICLHIIPKCSSWPPKHCIPGHAKDTASMFPSLQGAWQYHYYTHATIASELGLKEHSIAA
jgi:hypothetical protein